MVGMGWHLSELEDIEQDIISVITLWEPRVIILKIQIDVDVVRNELIYVSLSLAMRDSYEQFNLELPIVF